MAQKQIRTQSEDSIIKFSSQIESTKVIFGFSSKKLEHSIVIPEKFIDSSLVDPSARYDVFLHKKVVLDVSKTKPTPNFPSQSRASKPPTSTPRVNAEELGVSFPTGNGKVEDALEEANKKAGSEAEIEELRNEIGCLNTYMDEVADLIDLLPEVIIDEHVLGVALQLREWREKHPEFGEGH